MRQVKHILRMFGYKAIMTYWSRKIDVYVVGYPKTGNTWIWLMLCRMLAKRYGLPEEESTSLLVYNLLQWNWWRKLPSEIPVIHTTHNLPGFWSDPSDEMKLYMAPFKGKKVIHPIREPKDTLVSLYFHNVYRRNPPVFQGSVADMVYSDTYGIKKYLRFYKTWYDYKTQLADLLLIRYEDNRADPAKVVRDTARFIGIENLTEAIVEDVVSFCSFENMKNLERGKNTPGLSQTASSPSKHENTFKVRKGKIGGYKECMDEETIRYIDDLVARELPAFYGYTENSTEIE